MKILIATTYIYDKQFPEFTRNKTGFGIMVNDIFQSIAKKEEVYLISHVITKGRGTSILKHTLKDIFFAFRFKDLFHGIACFFKYNQSIKGRIQYFYYAFNKGYVRKIIKELKPDVVHIHGLNYSTKTYIEVCEELNIPYIVTLHGLIGLSDSVSAPKWDKDYEKEFLVKAEKKNILVTVISTGMKERVEENYIHHEAKNISVITNGTEIYKNTERRAGTLKNRFDLPEECKIGIVIGSIMKRKNQMQIIEAYHILPEAVKKNFAIFLCGRDMLHGSLEEKIKELGMEDKVFALGFQEKKIVNEMLEEADINIVASLDEGFGLSIIEAYSHGLPTVTFSDLDAISDLYEENAMILATDRNTETLSKAIEKALESEWDKNYIKSYSENFSLQKMADKYVIMYEAILSGEVF